MKRSEFVEIVNTVAKEECGALLESMKGTLTHGDGDSELYLAKIVWQIVHEMPVVAANVAASIIEKSGLVELEAE